MRAKILIVDDTRFNIRLLTDILEAHDYTVYSVSKGILVQDTAMKVKPDIILLDIMMPGIDGFEVCRRLKDDTELSDIPIIMVTSKTKGSDIKKALELGAFDYIKKPIDEWEVIARVQSALKLKHYQDTLKEMAIKDRLTGLYNHGLLIDLLIKELAKQQRKGYSMCFAMIDIDFFKNVNDTFGHMAGDDVLIEFSNILSSSIRKGDIVGRYGGEEFGVIMPEVDCTDGLRLFERIRKNVETHRFRVEEKTVNITISIGLCFKNSTDKITSSEVIKKADEALYAAKRNGRNCIEFCSAV